MGPQALQGSRAAGGGGPEAEAGDRLLDGRDHEATHEGGIAEAHIRLGRMDVDVDEARIDLDHEGKDRMPVGMHHVGIGAAHGPQQELVADRPPVDHEVDRRRRAAMEGRQPGEPEQPDALALDADRHGVVGEVGPEDPRQAPQQSMLALRFRRIGDRREVVPGEGEADRRVGDGEALDGLRHRLGFRAVALQELQAGRGCGKEVRHLDPRALGGWGGPDRPLDPGLDRQGRAGRLLRRAGGDRQAGHRADGRQRLSPEAEGGDRREVAVRKLRGRMPFHGKPEVVRTHAPSVVHDADEAPAARIDRHLDGGGARVDGVLDEFLDRRRRTLDHLARGDTVDKDGIEAADGHGVGSGSRVGSLWLDSIDPMLIQ